MSAVASRVTTMKEAIPKELSSTLWAFAKLACADVAFFERVADIAESKIQQCDAQSLSNLVWAFATVLIQPGALVTSIAQASLRSLHTFAPQELANSVWAFARLLFIDRPLCDAISQMCITKVRSPTATNIVNTQLSRCCILACQLLSVFIS